MTSTIISLLSTALREFRQRRNDKARREAELASRQAKIVLWTHPTAGGIGIGSLDNDRVRVQVTIENDGAEARNIRFAVTGNGQTYNVEGSPQPSLRDGQLHFFFFIPTRDGTLPEPVIRFALKFTFDDASGRNREEWFCRRFTGGTYPDWREWSESCA